MSIFSSHSKSPVNLSAFAQNDKFLTISDISDLVLPSLLNIPEDVQRDSRCSQVILGRLEKFRTDLQYIKDYYETLQFLDDAGSHFKRLLQHICDAPFVAAFTDDSRYRQLEEIVNRFKICIYSNTFYRPSPDFGGSKLLEELNNVPQKLAIDPPAMIPDFESPSAFRYFGESYELLDHLHKTCLLCFSAFPDGAEIKKRTIIYWWIGEELIKPCAHADGEETGHRILATLTEHGFVEDVIRKDRVTSSCRVRPFVRTVLIYLARAVSFFDYVEERKYAVDNLSHGSKCRVCFVKPHNGDSTPSSLQHLRRSADTYLECIETLFNVNKCYLDIKLHWFWKMKNIKALYLGRCDSKAIQHIEVKSCKFLSGLKYMRKLRLLSIQGVSKIVKLPESIGMAKNLRILDLRDCSDIEELPEAVKSLQKLTHLDLSGCYSLARLPKGVSSLVELQVLKGFLIREDHPKRKDLCSFHDLMKLKKLRKLSITTSIRGFPADEDLKVFIEMKELRKLTISWRGPYRNYLQTGPKIDMKASMERLEKLDLQHIPYGAAPKWLVSDELQKLKKLYIKGSKFLEDLGEERPLSWRVEMLRLKHLPQLAMEWSKLHGLFPNLTYLEHVKCPKLTSVPCSDEGVWLNPP